MMIWKRLYLFPVDWTIIDHWQWEKICRLSQTDQQGGLWPPLDVPKAKIRGMYYPTTCVGSLLEHCGIGIPSLEVKLNPPVKTLTFTNYRDCHTTIITDRFKNASQIKCMSWHENYRSDNWSVKVISLSSPHTHHNIVSTSRMDDIVTGSVRVSRRTWVKLAPPNSCSSATVWQIDESTQYSRVRRPHRYRQLPSSLVASVSLAPGACRCAEPRGTGVTAGMAPHSSIVALLLILTLVTTMRVQGMSRGH